MTGKYYWQFYYYPLDFHTTTFPMTCIKDLFAFRKQINPKGYVLWVHRSPQDLSNRCAGGTSIKYTVKE